MRESLPDLLREFGYATCTFSSAEEFLASDWVRQTDYLILDIAMPGMTGPELEQELNRRQQAIPTIFITANRDRLFDQGYSKKVRWNACSSRLATRLCLRR